MAGMAERSQDSSAFRPIRGGSVKKVRAYTINGLQGAQNKMRKRRRSFGGGRPRERGFTGGGDGGREAETRSTLLVWLSKRDRGIAQAIVKLWMRWVHRATRR
jgi:hypothetical protein